MISPTSSCTLSACRPLKSCHPQTHHTHDRVVCNATDSTGSGNSVPDLPSSTKGKGKSELTSPWKLMGRVVQEKRFFEDDDWIQQGLIRSGAASLCSLTLEEFEVQLTTLLVLMPFLENRLTRMNPKLLAALAGDVERTASRLIQLKVLLPEANVESIVSHRPSLLVDGEFEQIPLAIQGLEKHYQPKQIGSMVTKEPILLVEDIDQVLSEIARLVPGDAVAALQADPTLASQVGKLSHLSLW